MSLTGIYSAMEQVQNVIAASWTTSNASILFQDATPGKLGRSDREDSLLMKPQNQPIELIDAGARTLT